MIRNCFSRGISPNRQLKCMRLSVNTNPSENGKGFQFLSFKLLASNVGNLSNRITLITFITLNVWTNGKVRWQKIVWRHSYKTNVLHLIQLISRMGDFLVCVVKGRQEIKVSARMVRNWWWMREYWGVEIATAFARIERGKQRRDVAV